ncbi:MAG: GGDEF domain-containing protein [Elusimicrobia bacterium]|nr:GGDEF domain-containing protein [Elusimicrobiota bacterium]MDE2426032.1 GGDEF domain-containing protein [Elusimicrobiota bacterium]
MSARKRRRSDQGEPRSFKQLPHYVLYPIIGTCFGLGSPIGAFLLRFWLADPLLKMQWARNELDYNFLFYAYMGLGTVGSFLLFGYVLGLRSERQRVHNRVLSARVDELHLKSVTDALTGAYTHGYLHEILELELQRSLTNKDSLSILILDIDDFKRINDSHGHLFGDRVIKETAETVSASIRSEDILGRYGGDEFLLIMPAADRGIARQVASRICSAIAKNGYMATVSIGATTFSGEEARGVNDLIATADANLYRAKRQGKNQVCDAAGPEPPPAAEQS